MSEKPGPDRKVYVENRAKFLPEDLLPYANQWVAWSTDGSRIVAHHPDLSEVARQVETLGLEREDVVFDHLPPEGEVTTLMGVLLTAAQIRSNFSGAIFGYETDDFPGVSAESAV